MYTYLFDYFLLYVKINHMIHMISISILSRSTVLEKESPEFIITRV